MPEKPENDLWEEIVIRPDLFSDKDRAVFTPSSRVLFRTKAGDVFEVICCLNGELKVSVTRAQAKEGDGLTIKPYFYDKILLR